MTIPGTLKLLRWIDPGLSDILLVTYFIRLFYIYI